MQSIVLTYQGIFANLIRSYSTVPHTATPIFKEVLSARSERDWGFACARGYALQFLHYASFPVVVDRKTYVFSIWKLLPETVWNVTYLCSAKILGSSSGVEMGPSSGFVYLFVVGICRLVQHVE
jgi:hypothetical protein